MNRIENCGKARMLLVEDDHELATLLFNNFAKCGFEIKIVRSGEDAVEEMFNQYDVVVLDWSLPAKAGAEICREYRSAGGDNRILMIAGNRLVEDIEQGLDAGADDYLAKPFPLKELSARVRALLRRPTRYSGSEFRLRQVTLNVDAHRVHRGHEEIRLLPKEFSLLAFLMRNSDCVFTPEQLLDHVWESDLPLTADVVRTNIKRIRKKLDLPGEPSIISTIHGIGYRAAPVASSSKCG